MQFHGQLRNTEAPLMAELLAVQKLKKGKEGEE